MARSRLSSAKSYAKNLAKHVGRVAAGAETAKDAVQTLARDTGKLKSVLLDPQTPQSRKRAIEWARQGRDAYNKKTYDKAEQHFRQAIMSDPQYGLAHLYLGHTLYKTGHIKEAVASWERAIAADPTVKEARTARRKIEHVARAQNDVVEHLRDRLGKK